MNKLRLVPLLTGLVPIVAVHTTLVVSALQEYIPWCIPYIDSCTSISATGRHGAAYFIFKGTMIPAAMIMMLYWILVCRWITVLGEKSIAVRRTILIIGVTAALFLILYAVALGAAGDYLKVQRRMGVTVYFTFTYLGQLLLTWRLGLLLKNDRTRSWQLANCYSLLAIGILTLFLGILLPGYEDYEDAFEWIMALLIHLYFFITWIGWRNTGFKVTFYTHPDAR